MLRRATIGCVMLLTLHVSDALAQSSTLRAVQHLRRPVVRVVPRRVDSSAMTVRPVLRRLLALQPPVRPPGAPVITLCHGGALNHPALIVLDGVVLGLTKDLTVDDSVAGRAMSQLDTDDILSVEVLKGERAMDRYGERAHNGVVIITTKKKKEAAKAAIPAWSVEAVIGHGQHNKRAGEVYYNSDAATVIRYAASATLLRKARLSLYTKADYVPDINGDHIDICGFAPNGSCVQYFDDEAGGGIGLGIRTALTTYTSLGVLAGFGKYGERTRHFIESEFTLNLARHVGFVATARYMRWTRNGYPHWFAPITAGIQVF